jgi:hypothetical protein
MFRQSAMPVAQVALVQSHESVAGEVAGDTEKVSDGQEVCVVLEHERKLRVVPNRDMPDEEVIVEALDDGRFAVSLLRYKGAWSACVIYTRSQLNMLLARIPAALEVG